MPSWYDEEVDDDLGLTVDEYEIISSPNDFNMKNYLRFYYFWNC